MRFPLVTVKAFDAVRSPAKVPVPDPVVEMLDDVVIVFAVAIVPNPDAMDPELRAPTLTRLDEVTPVPKFVALKTLVPFIKYALPVVRLADPTTFNK